MKQNFGKEFPFQRMITRNGVLFSEINETLLILESDHKENKNDLSNIQVTQNSISKVSDSILEFGQVDFYPKKS